MHDWLRVRYRVLTVELIVVGLIAFGLFLAFLHLPRAAWLPAVVLWGITIGFAAYRFISTRRTQVQRRTTDRLSPFEPTASIRQAPARDCPEPGVPGKGNGRPERELPEIVGISRATTMGTSGGRRPSSSRRGTRGSGAEDDWDDIRATLFDVPGVSETHSVLENARVLTDDEYRSALSETEVLPTVSAGRADRRGTAPTIAMDSMAADPDEVDTFDERGERAPTLDEETWRKLRGADGGLADEP